MDVGAGVYGGKLGVDVIRVGGGGDGMVDGWDGALFLIHGSAAAKQQLPWSRLADAGMVVLAVGVGGGGAGDEWENGWCGGDLGRRCD